MSRDTDEMETPRNPGEDVINWRLRSLEKTVESLEQELGSLRRILLTFAVTVSASSVIFALGVANLTG